MQIIASVADVKVAANATLLDGAINSSVTTIVISADVFSDGNTIRIGAEEITLGTSGDGLTYTGCIRGANSTTAAAHATGNEVKLAAGTQILTHTFDGSTYFNCARVSGNIDFTTGIEEDGALKYVPRGSSYDLEKTLPFHRYQPANLKVFSLVVWLRYDFASEADFSAIFHD